MTENHLSGLLDFINHSPSCYHAAAGVADALQKAGYTQLREQDPWQMEAGGKYFVIRGGASLIAFRVPKRDFTGFMISASHSDFPTFRVRENAEVASAGGCVRLSVSDDGEGIPPEQIGEIWDRYYRVDREHKRAVMGTGLGLSIVKSVLEAHGAHYGVESAVGVGSVFWFELPVKEDNEE